MNWLVWGVAGVLIVALLASVLVFRSVGEFLRDAIGSFYRGGR